MVAHICSQANSIQCQKYSIQCRKISISCQRNKFRAQKFQISAKQNQFSVEKFPFSVEKIQLSAKEKSKLVAKNIKISAEKFKIVLDREWSISPSSFYGQLPDYQSHVLSLIYPVEEFSFKEIKTWIQSKISSYYFIFGVSQENQEARGSSGFTCVTPVVGTLCLCLKYRCTMGTCHHPAIMGNCPTVSDLFLALPIQWMSSPSKE